MRKIAVVPLLLLVFASFSIQVYAEDPDKELFQEAKIYLFDKKWKDAQEKLEELLRRYPESRLYSLAIFYKAKCLQEQRGKEEEALRVYEDYTRLKDRNKNLAEEAEISIIDLAYELYNKNKKSFSREIEKRLRSSNKVIKYYAAVKLSYVKDKKVASEGIPVLKRIIDVEKDDELRDRARIALLRIDPDALKDFEEERYERRAVIFKIRVYEKATDRTKFSLNIPWALVDLVFGAIPEEEKTLIKGKGYDLDRIRDELMSEVGYVLMIEGETTIIKMWID
jgi:hypothetical protein